MLAPGGRVVALNGSAARWLRLLFRWQEPSDKIMLARQNGADLAGLVAALPGLSPVVGRGVDPPSALPARLRRRAPMRPVLLVSCSLNGAYVPGSIAALDGGGLGGLCALAVTPRTGQGGGCRWHRRGRDARVVRPCAGGGCQGREQFTEGQGNLSIKPVSLWGCSLAAVVGLARVVVGPRRAS